MKNDMPQEAKSGAVIQSSHDFGAPGMETAHSIFDMVRVAVAVQIFVNAKSGISTDAILIVAEAPEMPGSNKISVSFLPKSHISRFNAHAANLAPHSAYFILRNPSGTFSDFYAHLVSDDTVYVPFDVDICGNTAEFLRAARISFSVMKENIELLQEKADDAWTYWATRWGFDPDDLSFLDPDDKESASTSEVSSVAETGMGNLKSGRVVH